MTRVFMRNPSAYFGDIFRWLHDDIFLGLYAAAYRTVPNAAAASMAAVAVVLFLVWAFFRAIFFVIAWIKGETRV